MRKGREIVKKEEKEGQYRRKVREIVKKGGQESIGREKVRRGWQEDRAERR
jgi:hypothetical protein